MASKRLVLCVLALAAPMAKSAAPIVDVTPGSITLSASAHSIHRGADAHSQIFAADFAIKPGMGMMAELARITDFAGTSEIGTVGVREAINSTSWPGASIAGRAGVSWLTVRDRYGETHRRTGLCIGLEAERAAASGVSPYGRAVVAFFDKPLWTLDIGVRYELRPRWFLSVGYRSYKASGVTLGGATVGVTYKVFR